MSYTNPCLQFGDNQKRVPGHEVDNSLTNPSPAPVQLVIADPANNTWDLVFSYETGAFYTAGAMVPAQDGAVINSWYQFHGKIITEGPPFLTIMPFADGKFVEASHFVDFSETPTTDNSINTATITQPSVTATVHLDLPDHAKVQFSCHSTSHSIIITTVTTHMLFEQIFVIYGGNNPAGNTITVAKDQGCLALAVYKKETSTGSVEISTRTLPKIPWYEWVQIVGEVVKRIAVPGTGEILEYVSPHLMAELEPEVLRTAINDISMRIAQLDNIKSVIAGLAEGKRS